MTSPYRPPPEIDEQPPRASGRLLKELYQARFGCYSAVIALAGLLYIAWKSIAWLATLPQWVDRVDRLSR